MSDFEQALTKVLTDDAAVAALVGTRVTFGSLDTDIARPFVSGNRISTVPGNTLNTRDALTNALFDLSAQADSLRGALTLAAAIRAAVENYAATVVTDDGSVVISAVYWNDMQQVNPRIGTSTYRISQIFSVWGEQT